MLLPLSRHACVNAFIASSILSIGNMVWLTFIVPYSIMSIVFSFGCTTTLLTLLFCLILVATNSQWYLIVRTLTSGSIKWWLLPVCVYAIFALPLCIGIGNNTGFNTFAKVYSCPGTLIGDDNILPIFIAILLLAFVTWVNHKIQYTYIQRETGVIKKTTALKKVYDFSFLERYGEIGTYLQLEIKLLMRNLNPRKAFVSGMFTMVFVSIIIIFSDIYDSVGMTNFWALYNFMLLGSMILLRALGYEGNYIDCLLVRRENILTLLKAKYIFYSALILLPFILMLPVVVSGKWSIYMLVSYAIFTAGFQNFLMFQVTIYNKQTIPLNQKLTSKGGIDGNYVQMAIMAALFVVSNFIVNILQAFASDIVAYTSMLSIGLLFIITHNIWLRNIYNRMMARKYTNIESFIASR